MSTTQYTDDNSGAIEAVKRIDEIVEALESLTTSLDDASSPVKGIVFAIVEKDGTVRQGIFPFGSDKSELRAAVIALSAALAET